MTKTVFVQLLGGEWRIEFERFRGQDRSTGTIVRCMRYTTSHFGLEEQVDGWSRRGGAKEIVLVKRNSRVETKRKWRRKNWIIKFTEDEAGGVYLDRGLYNLIEGVEGSRLRGGANECSWSSRGTQRNVNHRVQFTDYNNFPREKDRHNWEEREAEATTNTLGFRDPKFIVIPRETNRKRIPLNWTPTPQAKRSRINGEDTETHRKHTQERTGWTDHSWPESTRIELECKRRMKWRRRLTLTRVN